MQAAPYTTEEVAKLAKLSTGQVHTLAAAGLVGACCGFADLLVLRMAADLLHAGVGVPQVQWALRTLQVQLDAVAPLHRARLSLVEGRIVAQLGGLRWDLKTGQYRLPLANPNPAPARLAVLPLPAARLAESRSDLSLADRLFEQAEGLEEEAPQAAYAFYLQALADDPEHVEALINIGRLCSAQDNFARAAAYFRLAVHCEPGHSVAHFNLAVMQQDLGQLDAACQSYRRVLRLDPQFADAYFNLAALFDQQGDVLQARSYRHAYEQLTVRTHVW
jgi:tetratricopeptide (TPR) repeat protein